MVVIWLLSRILREVLVIVKALEPRVKEGKLVQGVGQFPFGIARSQKYSQKFFESKTGNSQIYCVCSYLSLIVKVVMDPLE